MTWFQKNILLYIPVALDLATVTVNSASGWTPVIQAHRNLRLGGLNLVSLLIHFYA